MFSTHFRSLSFIASQFRFLFIVLLTLSACTSNLEYPGLYKVDIKQGNIINEERLDLLQPGLTRDQVRYVMGSPLVVDIFDDSHWNYVYSLKTANGVTIQRNVRVVFVNDRVSEIIKDSGAS